MNEQIEEIFSSVYEYIDKLIPAFEARAFKLQQGRRFEVQDYQVFTEGFIWVVNALISVEAEFDIDVPKVQEKLDGFLTALENGDHVLVADILEYEFAPLLSSWQDKLLLKLR